MRKNWRLVPTSRVLPTTANGWSLGRRMEKRGCTRLVEFSLRPWAHREDQDNTQKQERSITRGSNKALVEAWQKLPCLSTSCWNIYLKGNKLGSKIHAFHIVLVYYLENSEHPCGKWEYWILDADSHNSLWGHKRRFILRGSDSCNSCSTENIQCMCSTRQPHSYYPLQTFHRWHQFWDATVSQKVPSTQGLCSENDIHCFMPRFDLGLVSALPLGFL